MIDSGAEDSQVSGDSDSLAGYNPALTKLIQKYDKYPEYLCLRFERPGAFLADCSSGGASLISEKSKEAIAL